MGHLPTVVDVADLAGVSRQTVSNVLNAPELVRPDTQERVREAIARLGYRPHASARRLRTRKSATLGIRLNHSRDGISGSVLDTFLHALTEEADRVNHRVLLFTAASPEEELRQLSRLVDGADVDGFVLTSTFHGDPRTEWLATRSHPFVTFGRPWGALNLEDPRYAWVDVDGRKGVAMATRSLLDQGLGRIAFLGWPKGSGTGDEREAGWRQALAAAGVPETQMIITRCEDRVDMAIEAVHRLTKDHPDVDAVIAVSDGLALGAQVATRGKLPVIGFDNTPISAALGFSSVDQQLAEVAQVAVAMLTGSSPGAPRHQLVEPRLISRG